MVTSSFRLLALPYCSTVIRTRGTRASSIADNSLMVRESSLATVNEVEELVVDSYRTIAPKRALKILDARSS